MKRENLFREEIEKTVNSILELTDAPCLILNVVTDTHFNPDSEDNVRRTEDTYRNICDVNKNVYSHGIVNMGDLTRPNDTSITREMSCRMINKIRGWMLEANRNVFIINGNHDGPEGSVPVTNNYNCMSTQNAFLAVRDGDMPYFYVDYPFVKVRALFLSTNTAGEPHVWGVSDVQLDWIRHTLLSAPTDYSVLIFSHIGTFDLPDFRTNRERVIQIFNEYHRHEGEFADKTGRCIAWCCGHEHLDWIVPTANSGLLFPVIVTTSSCLTRWIPDDSYGYSGYINYPREDRTITQDAWDTLIYRPDMSMLYMVRFGSGEDRAIDLADWK